MTKKERLEAAQKEAQLRVDEIDKKIFETVAEKESLDEAIEDKRERSQKTDNPKRREQLQADIEKLVAERKEAKAVVQALRPRRKKAAKRVRKTTRQLRNLFVPKYVDMEFDKTAVRGLTAQPGIRDTVGHYTAGPLPEDDEEAFRLWRIYDQAHKNQQWACIGYNWGVTPDGTVVFLRGREWVGAHTLSYNTYHDGCSLHGTTGHTWTRVQRRAFRHALKKFGTIDKPVLGHHQAPGQSTACPGSFISGFNSKGKSA